MPSPFTIFRPHRTVLLLTLVGLLVGGAAQAACDSAYYPVREGLSRTYQTAVQGKTVTYTETISKVSATGFTYTNSMMPSASSSMKCNAQGLSGLSQVTVPGMKITETHGVAWPSRLNVGSTWAYGFTMKGNVQDQAMSQKMEIKSKVIGREKVTVKAGTFNALKVETTTVMNMVMNGQKVKQPAMTSTTWLAEGVGMVKSSAAGTTVELVKYSK